MSYQETKKKIADYYYSEYFNKISNSKPYKTLFIGGLAVSIASVGVMLLATLRAAAVGPSDQTALFWTPLTIGPIIVGIGSLLSSERQAKQAVNADIDNGLLVERYEQELENQKTEVAAFKASLKP